MIDKRDLGLDTAKGIGSVFVLMLHLKPVQFQSPDQTTIFILNFIWDYIFAVAVPVFYLVSLHILFEKATTKAYIVKRVKRLLDILLFWCSFKVIFYLWNSRLSIFQLSTSLAIDILSDSVYYFIFDLILLSILSYYWLKIPNCIRVIISPFLIVLCVIYFLSTGDISTARLDNFLIYIPLTDLIKRKKDFKAWKLISFILWISFAFIEIVIFQNPFSIYARASVVAGALFTYIACKNLKPNIMKPFAEYSLGVYAIHLYFQVIVVKLLPPTDSYFYNLNLTPILVFFSTIALTLTTVRILDKTPLRKYVR